MRISDENWPKFLLFTALILMSIGAGKFMSYDIQLNILINEFTAKSCCKAIQAHDLGVLLGEMKDRTMNLIFWVAMIGLYFAALMAHAVQRNNKKK